MKQLPDILTPPPSSAPSPAFDDAARARRLALRALRARDAKPLTARALVKLAHCKLPVAESALSTLAAWRLIVVGDGGYRLAPVQVEGEGR